jgi:protein-tyrosine phosphatase
MVSDSKISILFVCMGNICRSPTAEAVFRKVVTESGLGDVVHIDSAGTHGYHVGEPPDPRTVAAAARRGYLLDELRARRFEPKDFERFDYVIAMDRENLVQLEMHAGVEHRPRLALLLSFAEGIGEDVPDPYYGGAAGFERVLDMIEEASRGLLETLRSRHSL